MTRPPLSSLPQDDTLFLLPCPFFNTSLMYSSFLPFIRSSLLTLIEEFIDFVIYLLSGDWRLHCLLAMCQSPHL